MSSSMFWSVRSQNSSRFRLSMFWSVRSQNSSRFRLSFGWRACAHYRRYGLNSKRSLTTPQTVAVFQVLCSLYGLTCVGYAQNSLEFVSCSPLIHMVGLSVCLYTDSLFAQIGDSNDKCSSSEVECWNEDAHCTAVADSVLMNSRTQKILCCIVSSLLSTVAAAWLCARRAL